MTHDARQTALGRSHFKIYADTHHWSRHKKIDIFAEAVTVTEVIVRATKFSDTPVFRSVEVYLCGISGK